MAQWLDTCIELQHARGIAAAPLAAISGGSSVEDRARVAQAVAGRDVAGFALCGFGTGEEPGAQRQALIEAVLGELPEDKPRFMSGVVSADFGGDREGGRERRSESCLDGQRCDLPHPQSHASQASPSEVLDAMALGVDIFDNSYVAAVTAGGYALSFPLRPPSAEGLEGAAGPSGQPPSGGQLGGDASKVNLRSVAYRLSKVCWCSCWGFFRFLGLLQISAGSDELR